MTASRAYLCAVAVAAAFAAGPVSATIIGGGGAESRDCLVALDAPVNTPESAPRQVRCVDGDACDSDHTVDGVCSFDISVCANSTFDPECSAVGVESIMIDHSEDNGDPKFDPDFQALRTAVGNTIAPPTSMVDRCTAPVTFRVPIKGPYGSANGCSSGRKKLKITSVSQVIGGQIFSDKDRLKLTCLPASNGCDPTQLFAGTFDRIQRQIFNQNCALSGCHDSQSKTGDLLLETGSSYDNLVNHAPNKPAAISAGWLRVDPGSPETSFLEHKITGDLPDDTYGARMPFGKPKLNSTLREIILLWIEAGAPKTGWVDGTF